jgi:hypothetical protein
MILSTYSFLNKRTAGVYMKANNRSEDSVESTLPGWEMVMWTIVWCPNRLSHKEPHCLHNIVRKTEVSELHARIMFLIGWSTEMERDS